MESIVFNVPTFNGHAYNDEIEKGVMSEFGPPYADILAYQEDGVRIVLGTNENEDSESPDIKIERRPRGWAFFLHPVAEDDPSGYLYFLDDGRSFVITLRGYGGAPSLEILDPDMEIPDIDDPVDCQIPPDEVSFAVECAGVQDTSGPIIADGVVTNQVLVNEIDDCLKIEEAFEFASDLRSLTFYDKNSKTWSFQKEHGLEFVEEVKRLLKAYNLAPSQDTFDEL